MKIPHTCKYCAYLYNDTPHPFTIGGERYYCAYGKTSKAKIITGKRVENIAETSCEHFEVDQAWRCFLCEQARLRREQARLTRKVGKEHDQKGG